MFHVGRLDGYWFRNWNDAAKKLQNDVELVNAKMANLVAPDLLEAAHAPTRCDGRRRNRSASCRSGWGLTWDGQQATAGPTHGELVAGSAKPPTWQTVDQSIDRNERLPVVGLW